MSLNLDEMQAHLDAGGKLIHVNALDLLAVVREQHARGLELAKALSTCIWAMNPPDRDGISMHEWNQRLKMATKQACIVVDGSVIAPAGERDD